jgi:uncharacterized membrane protein HdeD (DUF308 family)
MDQKIIRNIVLIVVGVILLVVAEFSLIQLPELLNLIIGLVGFILLVDGVYEIYQLFKK